MIGQIRTLAWFAARPAFWRQAIALGIRKFQPNLDTQEHRRQATEWAAQRATSVEEALRTLGLHSGSGAIPQMSPEILAEAKKRADAATIKMGGPGDVNLLYAAVYLSGAKRVVETGVAYGWSSLAALAALQGRSGAKLASVDMPYPKANNEAFVGVVVPPDWRASWTLVREPDRNGLPKAIAALGGQIDLCHYDSDKSYWGRQYGFDLMWKALTPGGVFISDDIQDNLAFKEFIESQGLNCAITKFENKFVGICRKPT